MTFYKNYKLNIRKDKFKFQNIIPYFKIICNFASSKIKIYEDFYGAKTKGIH